VPSHRVPIVGFGRIQGCDLARSLPLAKMLSDSHGARSGKFIRSQESIRKRCLSGSSMRCRRRRSAVGHLPYDVLV
jgi:hypothetical protein